MAKQPQRKPKTSPRRPVRPKEPPADRGEDEANERDEDLQADRDTPLDDADADEDEDLDEDEDAPPLRRRRRSGRSGTTGSGTTGSGTMADLMRRIKRMERRQSEQADNLVSMMGSIPAFAVGESMISHSLSQGVMMQNAVANQQRNNMLAMATTAGCVAQMLDMKPGALIDDFDDDTGDDDPEETH